MMILRDRVERGEAISQNRLEELVDAGEIARASIYYDPASPLTRVEGQYYHVTNGRRIEVPFEATTRMIGSLEAELLALPGVEARQRNTLLASLVFSVLPILIMAILIWFFFIRRIKLVSKTAPGTLELQAKAGEQQERFDKILDQWEVQAKRMDALLEKMESRKP